LWTTWKPVKGSVQRAMTDALSANRLEINGIVQGVGFRPFIYQLANHHGLKGEVANTATGVSLIIEGPENDIRQFIDDLPTKKPPLAHIVDVLATPEAVKGFTAFSIVKSRGSATRATLISPDVMVCDDCLAEMRDPADRRFGYPFINCTNCGPATPSSTISPTIGPKPACGTFACAPCARPNMTTPTTGASMPSPTPARSADPG
jgi:hydrogenase maturation protein HypF